MCLLKALRQLCLAFLFLPFIPGESSSRAQSCPFIMVPAEELTGILSGRSVLASNQPATVVFQSKLERDDDGAPNAYHIGNWGVSKDPGLDHICNGGSVLEFNDGRLVDKYREGGSVGSLSGVDPATLWKRSALCKQDYINLRDAGFPACGPSNLCMLWYGVATTPRRCGYANNFRGETDDRCGVPIRQKGADGKEKQFYLTRTSLQRPGSSSDTLIQEDFVNAAVVPFIVLPGGLRLPNNLQWSSGDFALVIWKQRVVAAVVGDTGPRGKFGEASRALLTALRGNSSATIDDSEPVTTILFPGTAERMIRRWPIDLNFLLAQRSVAMRKLGGVAVIKTCPLFETIR